MSRFIIVGCLVGGDLMRLFVFVCVAVLSVFAQQQPPQKRKRFDWSKLYAADDAKKREFKRKEKPKFSLKKPNKSWHFIDIEKFKKVRLEATKEGKDRERVRALLEATYCLLYREEKEATAVLLVMPLKKEAKVDDVVTGMLQSLLKQKGYALKSRKFFKRRGVRVCRLVYQIGEGAAKRMIERYVFVKDGGVWQFLMDCSPSDYKDLEKEFSKLFKSLRY